MILPQNLRISSLRLKRRLQPTLVFIEATKRVIAKLEQENLEKAIEDVAPPDGFGAKDPLVSDDCAKRGWVDYSSALLGAKGGS